jgi:ABC-2 type transport system permease protein
MMNATSFENPNSFESPKPFDTAKSFNRFDQSPFSAVMSNARLLRAYLTEARFESLRMFRVLGFSLPFLVLPAALYLLFGVVLFGEAVRNDLAAGKLLFTAFAVFGVMGPGMFGFGATVATEREQGLLTLKRALPAPPGSYLLAKLLMTMLFAFIVMATMISSALLLGHLPLTFAQCASVTAISIFGSLPFCAIGLFIGTRASGKASVALVNLIYVPMMHISGLFYPLPKFLRSISPVWPSYHLQQLLFAALGAPFYGRTAVHVAVLAGVTLVLTALSIRRLARVG